ncbi:MAG: EthD domain-containing protein [Alphaproteobacteria bacterium]|nr:EthD domain-containing protein [Alphaproteobacteria bacterium]
MIKLTFCLHRLPGLSPPQFHDYWLNKHGPLVRSHAAALGICRYVQTHAIETSFNAGLRGSRQAPEPFDGIAELWWTDDATFERSMRDPVARAAGKILLADEQTFIDLPRSPLWLNREHEIVAPATASAARA